MATFGNARTSSLLQAAEAAQNKKNTYEDQLAAVEYDNSLHTQDDLAKYQAYVQGRMAKTADPSKLLTLSQTLNSAQKKYYSDETQRASMAIQYGTGSLQDKYATLDKFRQDAMARGDYNTAQNLEAQMASVSVQMQNQAAAGSRGGGGSGSSGYYSGYSGVARDLKKAMNALDTLKAQGKVSPSDYDRAMNKLINGDPNGDQNNPASQGLFNVYASAKDDTNLTDSERDTMSNNLDNLQQSHADYTDGAIAERLRTGNQFGLMASTDANGKTTFVARPARDIDHNEPLMEDGKIVTDANGNPISNPVYRKVIYQNDVTKPTALNPGSIKGFEVNKYFGTPSLVNGKLVDTLGVKHVNSNEIFTDPKTGLQYVLGNTLGDTTEASYKPGAAFYIKLNKDGSRTLTNDPNQAEQSVAQHGTIDEALNELQGTDFVQQFNLSNPKGLLSKGLKLAGSTFKNDLSGMGQRGNYLNSALNAITFRDLQAKSDALKKQQAEALARQQAAATAAAQARVAAATAAKPQYATPVAPTIQERTQAATKALTGNVSGQQFANTVNQQGNLPVAQSILDRTYAQGKQSVAAPSKPAFNLFKPSTWF